MKLQITITTAVTMFAHSVQAQALLPMPKCPANTQPAIVTRQSNTTVNLPPVLTHTEQRTVTTVQCVPKVPVPPPAPKP